jgi:murein DD-endopeptidase MepM/ murein hydrolase activator NlpD
MTQNSSHRRSPQIIRALARGVAWYWRWRHDREAQRPVLGRVASHIALLLTVFVLVVGSKLKLQSLHSIAQVADETLLHGLARNVDAASTSLIIDERSYRTDASKARIVRRADWHTAVPERPRLEIVTYTVQPGDTAESIAAQFDLQPTTLMWSNPEMEKMPDLLKVGQVLTILPVDGIYHTVTMSDTLHSLAEDYKVDIKRIVECPFNPFVDGASLSEGQHVIIPGGTKPYEPQKVTEYQGPVPTDAEATGAFSWPSWGALTQGYWYGHRAVDIGASVGSAIRAADGGYIAFAGWTDVGYGYLLVVDHQNGYQTYYAHLSNIFAQEGQTVERGEVIGAMGSTGNSTGPHLHFEVRFNGYPTNPLIYLP